MPETWARVVELLQLPFLQRALLGGVLTGVTGGLLGSFVIFRQLAFFSDALGHSALLGIVVGVALGLNPTAVLMGFGVVFALGVTFILERTQLSPDTVLNIIYSSSLALAILGLSLIPGYRGNLNQLLFGDILGIGLPALWMSGLLLLLALGYIALTLPAQMLLTLDESLARARGGGSGLAAASLCGAAGFGGGAVDPLGGGAVGERLCGHPRLDGAAFGIQLYNLCAASHGLGRLERRAGDPPFGCL
jgi:zinc transport system permease protein